MRMENQIDKKMNSKFYYYLAAFLLFIWFFGFMIFNLSNVIHFVFLLAIVIFVVKLIRDFK